MPEHYTLKPDPYSSHRQIAAWLLQTQAGQILQRPAVIYDIGCAQGFLGQLLTGANFVLYGMDYDAVAVEAARPFYRAVRPADIEAALPPAFPERADVIVLADVLEHTRHPDDCLRRIAQAYAHPGARFVISLPNVAHLYVRLSLLAGRFDYAERGILDRTHLRFFTRATALALLKASQIRVDHVAVTPAPLPLVNPAFGQGRWLWPGHQFNAWLARLVPTLLGYQVIGYGTYTP
jgi:2-polyprenyl-3-methyl-5-hydroxy-6-metoxy-1,4-benzoquinol methylase